MASDINSDSSGSDSGSTPEEERIRRLFQTCDGNGDGYIDRWLTNAQLRDILIYL